VAPRRLGGAGGLPRLPDTPAAASPGGEEQPAEEVGVVLDAKTPANFNFSAPWSGCTPYFVICKWKKYFLHTLSFLLWLHDANLILPASASLRAAAQVIRPCIQDKHLLPPAGMQMQVRHAPCTAYHHCIAINSLCNSTKITSQSHFLAPF